MFTLDEPRQLDQQLQGVSSVVLAAGPFASTSAPMLAACLRTNTHYLDIAGEPEVYESCYAHHQKALEQAIVVMPGVGADVVPSDCLAKALHEKLPGATHLKLCLASDLEPSTGTLKTMLGMMSRGALARVEGKLVRVPVAFHRETIAFACGERRVVNLSWGDVVAAYRSTGIPNIEVLLAAPGGAALPMLRPLLSLAGWSPIQSWLGGQLDRKRRGPSETERQGAGLYLWGQAWNRERKVIATLSTSDAYSLTAATVLESIRRVESGLVPPGATTPSVAFGSGFIGECGRAEWRWL